MYVCIYSWQLQLQLQLRGHYLYVYVYIDIYIYIYIYIYIKKHMLVYVYTNFEVYTKPELSVSYKGSHGESKLHRCCTFLPPKHKPTPRVFSSHDCFRILIGFTINATALKSCVLQHILILVRDARVTHQLCIGASINNGNYRYVFYSFCVNIDVVYEAVPTYYIYIYIYIYI